MTAVVPASDAERRRLERRGADGVAFTRIAREFHDLVVAFTPNDTVRYVVRSLVALWSAQEQQWAAALTKRGEYPSVGRGAGRGAHAPAPGRRDRRGPRRRSRSASPGRHLAATQALVLERFTDDVVNAAPARNGLSTLR